MGKIVLKNKLTNDIMEFEGTISIIPDDLELVKDNKKTTAKKNGNGQGSLYYSEALEKWIGQISLPNGKRTTLTQRKKESVNDFKKRYRDTQNKVDTQTYTETSRETLTGILQTHIEQKNKDGITSDSSYLRDTYTFNQLKSTCCNFMDKPIQKVTIYDIEDAKDRMREYSSECINKMWGMLKLGFRIASSSSRRLIVFNIMEDVSLNKPISNKAKVKRDALSIEEENKLRDILNNEERNHIYRDIIIMQLDSGMRIGEVLARELNDFDTKENTVHIWNTTTRKKDGHFMLGEHTKIYNKHTQIDKGERTIPMTESMREIAIRNKANNMRNMYGLLFWDYKHNCLINHSEINSWLRRLNEKYKITNKPLSTHILRHTKITRMREAGTMLPVIQYCVGQIEGSDVTDEIYVTVTPDFVNKELKKNGMI